MTLPSPIHSCGRVGARAAYGAFSLVEVLIATALFTLLIGGLIAATAFGLRMYQTADLKANASDGARLSVGKISDEVRGAKIAQVGQVVSGAFQAVPDGQLQQGNALKLHQTTDTNVFVLYFLDDGERSLKRQSVLSGFVQTLAHSITTTNIFRVEDHLGNVLTNSQNNRVIRLSLEFFQTQYPAAPIGAGGLFDTFKLETCVTRRALE